MVQQQQQRQLQPQPKRNNHYNNKRTNKIYFSSITSELQCIVAQEQKIIPIAPLMQPYFSYISC